MNHFNKLYHGSMADVSELLEAGVELDSQLTGALLCNIVRRLALLESKQATPQPVKHRYKVTASTDLPYNQIHHLDDNVAGVYFYDAINSEDALDQFHASVPIKLLEDFEIETEIDG